LGDFSLSQNVYTGFSVYTASYSVGTGTTFLVVKKPKLETKPSQHPIPRLRLRGSIGHVSPWRAQRQLLLTVNTMPLHHKDELVSTVRDKSRCFSEIHTKQINTGREQNVELFDVKAGGTYGNHSSVRIGGK
jgi:hypothetical protein